MDNFAYYPKSESNKTKVYIDVFLLVRKAKRQKAKPSAIPKKKKKENLVLPPHLVFEILAPEESYPDKGACPEIKTSKMQVLHHMTFDYSHWTRDYEEEYDNNDDVYLLMNDENNDNDSDEEDRETKSPIALGFRFVESTLSRRALPSLAYLRLVGIINCVSRLTAI